MKVLVIDDLRSFPDTSAYKGVVYARTSAEAISILEKDTDWEQIWWDHDLGLVHETGQVDTTIPVVGYVCLLKHSGEADFSNCQMVIHTANPVGVRNIKQYFDRHGLDSVVVCASQNRLVGSDAQE